MRRYALIVLALSSGALIGWWLYRAKRQDLPSTDGTLLLEGQAPHAEPVAAENYAPQILQDVLQQLPAAPIENPKAPERMVTLLVRGPNLERVEGATGTYETPAGLLDLKPTNADGVTTFDAGELQRFMLRVKAYPYAQFIEEVAVPHDRQIIVDMLPGLTLSGFIMQGEQPLSNAAVHTWPVNTGQFTEEGREYQSRDDGSYQFDGLTPGLYELLATAPYDPQRLIQEADVEAPARVQWRAIVDIRTSSHVDIRFPAAPSILMGTVLFGGRPVPFARCSLKDIQQDASSYGRLLYVNDDDARAFDRAVTADAYGRFSIDGYFHGAGHLTVGPPQDVADEPGSVAGAPALIPRQAFVAVSQVVNMQPGEATEIAVEVNEAVPVRGRLRGPYGYRPCVHVMLHGMRFNPSLPTPLRQLRGQGLILAPLAPHRATEEPDGAWQWSFELPPVMPGAYTLLVDLKPDMQYLPEADYTDRYFHHKDIEVTATSGDAGLIDAML